MSFSKFYASSHGFGATISLKTSINTYSSIIDLLISKSTTAIALTWLPSLSTTVLVLRNGLACSVPELQYHYELLNCWVTMLSSHGDTAKTISVTALAAMIESQNHLLY